MTRPAARSRPVRRVRRNGATPWNITRVRARYPSWGRGGNRIIAVYDGPAGVAVAAVIGSEPAVLELDHGGLLKRIRHGMDHEYVRVAAKHTASGTQPSTIEILRAYGVSDARTFANARMAPLKSAILRELRAMRLYPYQGWDEISAALPPEAIDAVFAARGTPEYPAKADYYVSMESGQDALREAMAEEITEWMRTDAVKALKRLGKRAFDPDARDNPWGQRRPRQRRK